MLIRHALSEDIADLVELIRQLGYTLSREDMAANLHIYERMQGFAFVADEGGRAVGFVSGALLPLFHQREMMCRITALCVAEGLRGQGIGKSLLAKIEEVCRKKDCYYLEVTSGAHRKKDAHLFYESSGFETYGGRRFTKRLEPKP